jgi:hypothetical protein
MREAARCAPQHEVLELVTVGDLRGTAPDENLPGSRREQRSGKGRLEALALVFLSF